MKKPQEIPGEPLKDRRTGVARRNVAYELGYSHATFGPEGTLVLVEEGVEVPTNVSGMQVVYFKRDNLPDKFNEIREHLVRMHILDELAHSATKKRK